MIEFTEDQLNAAVRCAFYLCAEGTAESLGAIVVEDVEEAEDGTLCAWVTLGGVPIAVLEIEEDASVTVYEVQSGVDEAEAAGVLAFEDRILRITDIGFA